MVAIVRGCCTVARDRIAIVLLYAGIGDYMTINTCLGVNWEIVVVI